MVLHNFCILISFVTNIFVCLYCTSLLLFFSPCLSSFLFLFFWLFVSFFVSACDTKECKRANKNLSFEIICCQTTDMMLRHFNYSLFLESIYNIKVRKCRGNFKYSEVEIGCFAFYSMQPAWFYSMQGRPHLQQTSFSRLFVCSFVRLYVCSFIGWKWEQDKATKTTNLGIKRYLDIHPSARDAVLLKDGEVWKVIRGPHGIFFFYILQTKNVLKITYETLGQPEKAKTIK